MGVAAPAANVKVALPEPGAAMVVGLKVALAPEGRPVTVSATAVLKPPSTVVEIVAAPVPPCAAVTVVGDESVKSATAGNPIIKLDTIALPCSTESFPCIVVKPLLVVNPVA